MAASVMKESGIAIDDLYTPALANAAQWQSGDKVHFGAVESQKRAEQVARSIREALNKAEE